MVHISLASTRACLGELFDILDLLCAAEENESGLDFPSQLRHRLDTWRAITECAIAEDERRVLEYAEVAAEQAVEAQHDGEHHA